MEKLNFDMGVKRYKVGSGVLSFNPTDPNLYGRFFSCLETLEALENQLSQQPLSGEALVKGLQEADKQVKAALGGVFPGNDMEAIFQGVSLLAVGTNGQRLLTNFLAALEPILRAGALSCARAEAEKL